MAERLAIRQWIIGLFKGLDHDEPGMPLVEYAFLLALVALLAVMALLFIDPGATTGIGNAANHLNRPA